MVFGFNWKIKNHCMYYCKTCYPIWGLKPWDLAEHKELPYDNGVYHCYRWSYTRCIHEQGSLVTISRIFQGLPGSPEIDKVVYQESSENSIDTYDQLFCGEVYLLD